MFQAGAVNKAIGSSFVKMADSLIFTKQRERFHTNLRDYRKIRMNSHRNRRKKKRKKEKEEKESDN